MITKTVACPLCSSANIKAASGVLRLLLCLSGSLRFRDPQPDDEALQRIYRHAYSDSAIATGSAKMAGTTDAIARIYVGQFQREQNLSGMRVLDFGAGLGSMSRALSEAGATVTAIDPYSAPNLRLQGLDAYSSLEQLASAGPYDGCSAIEVLEHLREPWTVMAQLSAMLRPGGFLLLTTPNANGLKPRLSLDSWIEAQDLAHLFLFAPRSLETALRKSGFKKWERLQQSVRFSENTLTNLMRSGLQTSGLDGQLRYIAWT